MGVKNPPSPRLRQEGAHPSPSGPERSKPSCSSLQIPDGVAWPGHRCLQLLSQPLVKPGPRFPLGEGPHGWAGQGPNSEPLTNPSCLAPGPRAGEQLALRPSPRSSSPAWVRKGRVAGPGLASQPELASLLFCTPKPGSVCREPRSQPPASAAVAPSRAKPGCVILGGMAAHCGALGVFVHKRGGGIPRGVSQGQASEGSAGLSTWASSRRTRGCQPGSWQDMAPRTASKGGAQRQPANR